MAINCAYACMCKDAYGLCNMSVCQLYVENIKIARTMLQLDSIDRQQFIDEAGRYFSSPEALCKTYKINYKSFMTKVNKGMNWIEAVNQCTFEQATLPGGGLEYSSFNREKAKQRREMADSYFGMTSNQYNKNNNGFGFGEQYDFKYQKGLTIKNI